MSPANAMLIRPEGAAVGEPVAAGLEVGTAPGVALGSGDAGLGYAAVPDPPPAAPAAAVAAGPELTGAVVQADTASAPAASRAHRIRRATVMAGQSGLSACASPRSGLDVGGG